MKGLSLTQPWATLVAVGAKGVETRSWTTRYRGPLAIAASKGFPRECRELCSRDPFREALALAGYRSWKELPRGVVVATARLAEIARTDDLASEITTTELAFGDYSSGRFAWRLADVYPLLAHVPVKGALGLFDLPPEVLAAIEIDARANEADHA